MSLDCARIQFHEFKERETSTIEERQNDDDTFKNHMSFKFSAGNLTCALKINI